MALRSRSLIPTIMTPSGSLERNTQMLANRQVIEDLIVKDEKPGISKPNGNRVISMKPFPGRFTVTVDNTNESAKDIRIFNNDDFTALPGGVTATFSDGHSGKLIDRLLKHMGNGNGLLVYGFNLIGYDADDAKSDAVIDDLSLDAHFYTGRNGSSIPMPIDISGGERKSDTKDGVLLVKQLIEMNFLFQLALHLEAQTKVKFVFFTEPIKD